MSNSPRVICWGIEGSRRSLIHASNNVESGMVHCASIAPYFFDRFELECFLEDGKSHGVLTMSYKSEQSIPVALIPLAPAYSSPVVVGTYVDDYIDLDLDDL